MALMQLFIQSRIKQPTLQWLNQCRMYLRVFLLSDIVSGTGDCILPQFWEHQRPADTTLDWPNTTLPSQQAWTYPSAPSRTRPTPCNTIRKVVSDLKCTRMVLPQTNKLPLAKRQHFLAMSRRYPSTNAATRIPPHRSRGNTPTTDRIRESNNHAHWTKAGAYR